MNSQNDKMLISSDQAFSLIHEENFNTDIELDESVLGKWAKERDNFEKLITQTGIDDEDIMRESFSAISPFQIAVEYIETNGELYYLEEDGLWENYQLKDPRRPNAVFHLGKAMNAIIKDGLGLFFAYLAPPSLALLFHGWLGYSLWDLGKTIINCYVILTDEKEQQIFETIYKLQNQFCVVNYDSLTKEDFKQAYGKVSPNFDDICDALSGKINEKDIKMTLKELTERKILVQRNGRWSVPFW